MNSQPSADVTISISLSGNAPNNLEISSGGNNVSGPSGSIDDHSLMIIARDNDTPGITYAKDNAALPNIITLAEGDTDIEYEYTISLNTQPSHDVMIQISLPAIVPVNLRLSDGTQTADMANESITLTFTLADWDTPQTVTLSLVDDDIVSGEASVIIMHASTSLDSDYDSQSHSITLMIIDNDLPPGITYNPPGGSITLTEGSTYNYTVVLNTLPCQPASGCSF